MQKDKKKESYIYIVADDADNYKVGVSKRPEVRVKQLSVGNPKHLKLVEKFKVPSDIVYKLEKECHEKVSYSYPKRGEWFINALLFDLRNIVENVCERHIIVEESATKEE